MGWWTETGSLTFCCHTGSKAVRGGRRCLVVGERDREGWTRAGLVCRSGGGGGGGPAGSYIRGGDGGRLKPMPALEEIEATKKKFTGRCRLFVGNLPNDMAEEELKKLFEEFGEVAECYMSGKGFAFIRLVSYTLPLLYPLPPAPCLLTPRTDSERRLD